MRIVAGASGASVNSEMLAPMGMLAHDADEERRHLRPLRRSGH
jgi:hypothetical protein